MITVGPALDFRAYTGAGNDRDVLRYVTDEIMNAIMELSGQTYVDVVRRLGQAGAGQGPSPPPANVLEPSGRRPGRRRRLPEVEPMSDDLVSVGPGGKVAVEKGATAVAASTGC